MQEGTCFGAVAAPRIAASSAFRLRHVRAGLLSPRGLAGSHDGSHCLAGGHRGGEGGGGGGRARDVDQGPLCVGGQSVDPTSLDPTQWKEQDHYAVLGLGDVRHAASQEQIKKACE